MKIVVALVVLAALLLLGIWLIRRAGKGIADRMFGWSLALFSLSLFLSPAVVWAADAPAVASPFQDLLTSAMQLVALVLAGLIATALGYLLKKFKIEIRSDQQEMIRKGAHDAIYFAEEWAAKRYGADQVAGKGAEQLSAATNFLLAKIPGLDQVAAQQAIHAALGAAPGLGASGATGAPSL
jgi:hypothetical protein